MATTPPPRVTDLARKYRLDIDTATYPAVNYEQLLGIKAAKLIEELRALDDEGYEDDGAMREEVTGYAWRIEMTLKRSRAAGGITRLATHAFLRAQFLALREGGSTAENEFGIRWYHRDGVPDEAHEGRVYVKIWTPPDDKAAQDEIQITLFGQGQLAQITNPNADLTPVVSSVTPATGNEAGGELIVIHGTHFTGATDVDFGANPATEYTIISDSTIVAIAPAGSGTVQTKVTTAAGASADTAADNYVYTA